MRSDISGVAERRSRRFVQFVGARPWLSGAALLGLATAALFTWFLTQQWDDVGLSIPSGGRRNQGHAGELSALGGPPPLVDVASAERSGSGSIAAHVAVHRPITPPLNRDLAEDGSSALETPVQPVAAEATAPPAWRGAWLTGTIEVMTDNEPPRHAARTAWPGLAGDPAFP